MAKIMLVEDDNNLRDIYAARLQAEGYDIVAARDGEEALALAVKERPDLIVSDVMMPKISGFDMLDILRTTPETKETKVIMMTALSQAEDKARADELGANRYLVKSQVTLEDVVKAVAEVLAGADQPSPSLQSLGTLTPTVEQTPLQAQIAPTPMPIVITPTVITPTIDSSPVVAQPPVVATAESAPVQITAAQVPVAPATAVSTISPQPMPIAQQPPVTVATVASVPLPTQQSSPTITSTAETTPVLQSQPTVPQTPAPQVSSTTDASTTLPSGVNPHDIAL